MTCLKCGRTVPLQEDSVLEDRLHQLAEAASFHIQGHQLEVQGLCANCRPDRDLV
jgi:Fe2+ or Zn2+ uptake regulation protein